MIIQQKIEDMAAYKHKVQGQMQELKSYAQEKSTELKTKLQVTEEIIEELDSMLYKTKAKQ